ncbi:hydrogenase large subunit [Rhodomicrobium lacus]|uniref:hydrogenase large subunit n=1 Tax=Rhodomicrobium lacus TaxID=2498452 RepID=UPI0026E15C01|nr:NADH-quinone oxidoreductase subunit C [Rhodomicrobium lacus]WKW52409.1 NADH-quinone oxidoreductase subunit C [Rhodomicrobium lacus]
MIALNERGADTEPVALADAIRAALQVRADGFARIEADTALWIGLARGCAAGWHDLGALWIDDHHVRMALWDARENCRAIVSLTLKAGAYPSVGLHHAPALRLERAMRDLYGAIPEGIPDERRWLDHGVWPGREHEPGYHFLSVDGNGLHQIPVGPVHAGIIEPGHFRFTANGETVARLEARLGYVHKGVEALAQGAPVEKAAKLAARMSGDSTVAYSFAFSRAVEAALGWDVPQRGQILRGVMAELERLSHHVGDVGGICNDAAVAALLARCSLIREDILRTQDALFGHRMMMDAVVPGGVVRDIDASGAAAILALLERIETGFHRVIRAYDQSPSLQNRTHGTGIAEPDFIRQFAAGGFVGRAGGRAFDARRIFPYPPYDAVAFKVPTREESDVDARIWIRIEEIAESAAIIRQLLGRLEDGPIRAAPPPFQPGSGAALVEAFRGDLFVAVRIEDEGRIAHMHARDASWFQWPLLETAIKGNIVADFPLCNKSFNCSYSGVDL